VASSGHLRQPTKRENPKDRFERQPQTYRLLNEPGYQGEAALLVVRFYFSAQYQRVMNVWALEVFSRDAFGVLLGVLEANRTATRFTCAW
jgi:hypothetical protein